MTPATPIQETQQWEALVAHRRALRGTTLRDLLAADPSRGDTMVLEAADLTMDHGKHIVVPETIALLTGLAERAGLPERREAMFTGQRINRSEDRPVLHVALRAPEGEHILVDGVDVVPEVHETLARMHGFADRVRSGSWTGATGKPVRAVINIGIGGSDLGPAMAHEALRDFSDRRITCRFVSNVDAADLWEATRDLDPAETLFIVSSKSFGTLETLTNARSAREWLTAALGDDAISHHFVAVSTAAEKVAAFGIDPENMFGFWDWVGGRYSVDSAIGLSLMISVGPDRFAEFLAGFRAMDEHFRSAPLTRNLPVIMGLLRVWERNFLGMPTHAVVPYSHHLALFPAYLQQLEMESNGKSVRMDGSPVDIETGAIVWGTAGTNGQHAYFQLLHQGTQVVPADLIGFVRPSHEMGEHQDLLVANMLAQGEALALGKRREEVAAEGVPEQQVPHRTFAGNRPTITILAPALTPATLGSLIALYEHSVFTQGVIWGIDSFDQWGVELGKQLAGRIAGELAPEVSEDVLAHDASTNALIRRYRRMRDAP
jgi:glucose-6-phosphate isomerase